MLPRAHSLPIGFYLAGNCNIGLARHALAVIVSELQLCQVLGSEGEAAVAIRRSEKSPGCSKKALVVSRRGAPVEGGAS
jgi:hypothetical protein